MTAAQKIKTPVMTMPLLAGKNVSDANIVANRMRKLKLAECLAGVTVEETPVARCDHIEGSYARVYRVVLQFFRWVWYCGVMV